MRAKRTWFTVKTIWGQVIAKQRAVSLSSAISTLVKKGVNLNFADLRGVNLCESYLIDAKLNGADLTGAHLYKVILNRASLIEANINNANLKEADLRGAILKNAFIKEANLVSVNLNSANLNRADLTKSNLYHASLNMAYLKEAILTNVRFLHADLRNAVLTGANLTGADLFNADLRGAQLDNVNFKTDKIHKTNLQDADLSGATGLLDQSKWMANNFEKDELGWIVYKRIGITQYAAPARWVITPGEFITEICSPCRESDCACGINFGTIDWCKEAYPLADLWKCRIRWEDGPGIVVPYNTEGKARCERLELLELIKKGD